MGHGLSDRFARSGRLEDLEEGRIAYRKSCRLGQEAAVEEALRSARNWARWSLDRSAWGEAIEATSFGLQAIDRLFAVQVGREVQESALSQGRGLAALAAYARTQAGDPAAGVEAMEQGRARMPADALEQNRRDLAHLPDLGHADLYSRFQQLLARRRALLQVGEVLAAGEPVADALSGLGPGRI